MNRLVRRPVRPPRGTEMSIRLETIAHSIGHQANDAEILLRRPPKSLSSRRLKANNMQPMGGEMWRFLALPPSSCLALFLQPVVACIKEASRTRRKTRPPAHTHTHATVQNKKQDTELKIGSVPFSGYCSFVRPFGCCNRHSPSSSGGSWKRLSRPATKKIKIKIKTNESQSSSRWPLLATHTEGRAEKWNQKSSGTRAPREMQKWRYRSESRPRVPPRPHGTRQNE